MTVIFITGATGYIGGTITELAVKEGYTVRGLSRSEAGDEKIRKLGATPVRGDLTTLDVLSAEAAAADAVLQLAFTHDYVTGKMTYDQVLELDAHAMEALATPLIGTEKPLVFTSGSALVEADPTGKDTDETAPYNKNTPIARYKSEIYGLSWAEKGVKVSVIRMPLFVYGRTNMIGFAAQLVKTAVQSHVSDYVDEGQNFFSTTYVDDAARLYLLVMNKSKGGEIWNGVTRYTTYKQIAEAVGKMLNVPVKSITAKEAQATKNPYVGLLHLVNDKSTSAKAFSLGWQPIGPTIIEEIETGSYVEVAEKFKQES